MIWILIGFQLNIGNVCQVSSAWFLVDWALVHPGISGRRRVNSVDMYDRKWCEKNLCGGFDKLRAPSIPAGTIQKQTVDVHALSGRLGNIVLEKLGDVIVENDAV